MTEFKINGTLNATKGAKIKGTNYILVSAAGTDVQNAAELQAAYTAAVAMSPTSTNVITIVASPGYYNFTGGNFEMTDEWINLVSLDGNRSIIFNGTYAIYVRANNVYVNGVDTLTLPFKIDDNLSNTTIENCKGGDYSFGYNIEASSTISGKFIDCEGGNYSFGAGEDKGTFGVASGTFTRCKAGTYSFGSGGDGESEASGIFTDCTAGNYSFGGGSNAIASGTFTRCTSGTYSFGNSGASGTFTNCTAGDYSFGNSGASGTFTNCTAGDYSFSFSSNASGIFINCTAGVDSFGNTLSGTCTNCTGGVGSFGGTGTLSGKLYYCRLTAGTFQTVTFPGITRLCLDGNNSQNDQTSEE